MSARRRSIPMSYERVRAVLASEGFWVDETIPVAFFDGPPVATKDAA